eukprot:TRINITY_DN355_c1_g2_i1.p1 TRINITY_DN355_c1_g2~~TRINITY_DN355_c1_g2_i1.p1  ORF type:complete len:226 (+),score=70.60 TRINITY_DN355_c1_g2_i1:3-680(+)
MAQEPRGRKRGKGTAQAQAQAQAQQLQLQLPLKVQDAPEDMAGPNRYTNWGVPGLVLVGAFPRLPTLEAALRLGITSYVCLAQDDELARSGGNYLARLKQLVAGQPASYPHVRAGDLEFIHFPIYDKQTAPDNEVAALVQRLLDIVVAGKKLYMHCMGGHGRTGTILALMLAHLYALEAYEALELCTKWHDTRQDCKEKPGMYHSPESHAQKAQVYRMLSKLDSS